MPDQIEIKPIQPRFVAEITGPRLDRDLTGRDVESIKSAWAEFPVLVFPDQPLSHVSLAAFARQLGEFGIDPFVRPLAANDHVIEVRREPGESTPIFGSSWHSDWSFQAEPPSGTLLHAKTVPPVGGDTLFADCTRAFESLPEDMKYRLSTLKGVHTAAPSYGPQGLFAKDDASRSMSIIISEEAENTETHPVVRTHPVTGRRSLFVNHVYTTRIEHMDDESGQALLNKLFRHMTKREFVHRQKWQPDMLVLWDNRCVVHHAGGGYDGYQRVMHRTILAGDRPY